VVAVPGKGRVLVFSMAKVTSGVLPEWGATSDRPGVNLLPDLSDQTAGRVGAAISIRRRPVPSGAV
jgi:hypothetical protein